MHANFTSKGTGEVSFVQNGLFIIVIKTETILLTVDTAEY